MKSSLPARLVCALLAFIYPCYGEPFLQGDQVRLIRSEPLLFRDQFFTQGTEGASFAVLLQRPEQKKVFLAAKDQSGKDIALSVAEDAVVLTESKVDKVREQTTPFIKAGKVEEAEKLINEAVLLYPQNTAIESFRGSVINLKTAKSSLAAAKAKQVQARATAFGKRKNANVTDRPNPLNSGDGSNQTRAERLRQEANEIEESASRLVADAEAAYTAAMAALSETTPPTPELRRADPLTGRKFMPQPGAELTAEQEAHNRIIEALELQEAGRDKSLLATKLRQWTDDEAGTPPNPDLALQQPGYEETVEFINGMIRGPEGHKLWFGKRTGKMILESKNEVIVFDPATFTPVVKFTASDSVVVMNCTNGRTEILRVSKFDGTSAQVKGLKLRTGDNLDRDKLVKACSHLIEMFGGKPDSF